MVSFYFGDQGVVIDRAVLSESESLIESPVAGWHAVLLLDANAVIFEVKQTPYAPFKEENFAPWSPVADDENHKVLMRCIVMLTLGNTGLVAKITPIERRSMSSFFECSLILLVLRYPLCALINLFVKALS